MKMKQVILAASVALTLASAAQADETLRITGSTAFRASAVKAVEQFLGSGIKGAFVGSGNTQNGGETGATYCVFTGSPGGVNYTIQLTWTGSVGGIEAVQHQADIKSVPTNGWLSVSNIAAAQAASTTPGTAGIYPIGTGTYDSAAEAADADFSDSLQSTTGVTSVALTGVGSPSGNGGSGRVGVIPFGVVFGNVNTANNHAATYPNSTVVKSISSLQYRALLSGGIPLAQLTNDQANPLAFTPVYAIGRNFDSGTRLSTLIETGYTSVANFGPSIAISQIGVAVNGDALAVSGGASLGASGSTITDIGSFPPDTLFAGTSFQLNFSSPGLSGYSSGGTVSKVLQTPGSSVASVDLTYPTPLGAPGYLMSYLGRSDATSAVTGRGIDAANSAFYVALDGFYDDTVNAASAGNIENGLSHAWEYEYMYKTVRPHAGDIVAGVALDANQNNALNAIADAIFNNTGNITTAAGIPIGSMSVSKTLEGDVIHY